MSGLVRLAELKPPEGFAQVRVWRLYSEGGKPLPLCMYYRQYWWAGTVPGEVGLRLGGAAEALGRRHA